MRSYWERAKADCELGCKARYFEELSFACTEEDEDGECYFYNPFDDDASIDAVVDDLLDEALGIIDSGKTKLPLERLSSNTPDAMLFAHILYRALRR